jgi:hypothetical protein
MNNDNELKFAQLDQIVGLATALMKTSFTSWGEILNLSISFQIESLYAFH